MGSPKSKASGNLSPQDDFYHVSPTYGALRLQVQREEGVPKMAGEHLYLASIHSWNLYLILNLHPFPLLHCPLLST